MYDTLKNNLQDYGQEHLLAFWDQLNDEQQAALAAEIRAVDFGLIDELYARRDVAEDVCELVSRAESPPAFRLDSQDNPFSADEAREAAREALRTGRLGVVLVAGGQGTRLGFDLPKGMYPIGPLSEKSLFQIHVEKIVAAAQRYDTRIPLYLMTSPATDSATRQFFYSNDRFGLAEEDLRIFCQGTMPAVDAASGKILMASAEHLALSPDGHGGMLAAFDKSGALADAQRRGVEHLFYFQVDNPLVDICGLEFVGYHLLARSELSSQVIAKHDSLERVGNIVSVDDRLHVIEYSDLPDELARRSNPDGSLAIWAGSIAVHVMDVAMLDRLAHQADSLPFHHAMKKVAWVDAGGHQIDPETPNAIKFERFIFDLLPLAHRAIVVEVDRTKAFAPLKNAPGERSDTPESVRTQMVALHTAWLQQAGAEVAAGTCVEISPLWALDADEAAEKIEPNTRVTEDTYFC